MILVRHYVARSSIHGLGVFTNEPIENGTVVWRYDPVFDIEIPLSLFEKLSKDDAELIMHHAEYLDDLKVYRLGNDGDIFMNHSSEPSLIDLGDSMIAARELRRGAELTCDYASVCVKGYNPKLKKTLVGV